MTYRLLAIDRSGALAEVRLAHQPPVALPDATLLREIDEAAADIGADHSVAVVLLVADAPAPPESASIDTRDLRAYLESRAAFRSLELMGPPIIALIEHDARGAAVELALACDLRICAEHVRFSMPQTEAGIVPALGGTQRLPRLIGRSAAARLLLLGESLEAREALACGLVNRVTPAGAARDAAREMAESIAERGPLAVRYAKESIQRGLDMPLEQALRYETDLTVILQTTEDRAEGVRAFAEKRTPKFRGR